LDFTGRAVLEIRLAYEFDTTQMRVLLIEVREGVPIDAVEGPAA